ncbi:MAG TPA: ABC transporter ATP-binding protein [Chloroflexota bacterium]|jgi:branched-chain amino acid transport system ATP-binding protein
MLELRDLHAYYGASHIVQGISLSVGQGEAVGLMGRNGVGKTTTLKSIMGLEARTRGAIVFDGADISGLASHVRAARGLGYVPEERAVFPQMTVEENLRIGALIHRPRAVRDCLEAAYELFPILRERRVQLAGTLSGGQQKMLSLARGLALRPKLLMVDEPTEGLMPANVALTAAALAKATQLGVAVLVVDASFDLIAETCSRLYAMDRGVLTGMFRPSEFSGPDELAARYLGAVNA